MTGSAGQGSGEIMVIHRGSDFGKFGLCEEQFERRPERQSAERLVRNSNGSWMGPEYFKLRKTRLRLFSLIRPTILFVKISVFIRVFLQLKR